VWVIVSLAEDLKLALDRVSFARALGLEPDGWQEELLRSTSDRVLLNCCRQSGKSTISGVIALHRALYYPSSLVLCLAPALRQSQELFGKVLGFYRDLERPVPAYAERKLSLELENGSRIVTLLGTEKTIRGFSGAALLIVDEAARVDDALYYAVRPMLAVSGGALMMLSTPYGKRGGVLRGVDRLRHGLGALRGPRSSVSAHLGGVPRGGAASFGRLVVSAGVSVFV
jgi:hypothetical protein